MSDPDPSSTANAMPGGFIALFNRLRGHTPPVDPEAPEPPTAATGELVSQARAYAAKIVPEARGDAQQIRTQAEGYKTAAIARATGDATRFSLLLDEYRNAPEVTRKRLWLDTVQQVLGNNRKVVGGDSRQLIYVPMGNSAQATAQPPAGVIPTEVLPQVESTPSSSRNSARTPRPAGREEAQP